MEAQAMEDTMVNLRAPQAFAGEFADALPPDEVRNLFPVDQCIAFGGQTPTQSPR